MNSQRAQKALQAIAIELRSTLAQGWSLAERDSDVVVLGPDTQEFKSEVWRLARFIAYDNFVSIERVPGDQKQYKVCSRTKSGLSFEVRLLAGPATAD
jgi:hypothetical protein